jgi:DNA-binding response OmpR family regulator
MPRRKTPLIVVASTSSTYGEEVAARLRLDGNVVYVTHSAEGCLRVATSVAPDVVLIDRRLPHHLEDLLHAHPTSAQAAILHLDEVRTALRAPRTRVASPSATAGPHAA